MTVHGWHTFEEVTGFRKAIGRSSYAKIISYSAGLLSGASLVQLDYAHRTGADGFLKYAFAATCVISIAVVFHVLGHVSRDRLEVIHACSKSAVAALAGALVATLLGPAPLLICVLLVAGYNGFATVNNWSGLVRTYTGKARTVVASAGIALAQVAFLLSLLHEIIW